MISIVSICLRALREVLFPACCAACGRKLLKEEQVICSSCVDSIVRTEHAVLQDNGIDMLFAQWMRDTHRTIHYEHGAAWAYYNQERGKILRGLIEKGKFGLYPNPHIFYELGRIVANEYVGSALLEEVEILVPIPLHSRRFRERGFNQAEYICLGMSDVLHIPIDTEHLVRTRNNAHQSRSSFAQRKGNVKDLFAIRYPEEWKNKHILLVDDVITSGATIFECMRQVSSIRGCRVSVFALGWAHN